MGVGGRGRVGKGGGQVGRRGRGAQAAPHVGVDDGRLPGAPDEAAGEEGHEQGDAVVELGLGAGHVELVEEPVDVEEGGGELVEDEDGGVVIEVGALGRRGLVRAVVSLWGREGRRTKPKV